MHVPVAASACLRQTGPRPPAAKQGRCLVDADQQLALGALAGHEGIAPHEGRHVARIPLAVGVDEQIFRFAQAEQHRRHRAGFAAGENDRVFARALEKLAGQNGHRVGLRGIGETVAGRTFSLAWVLSLSATTRS
jgi:hypothetical protein